MSSRRSPERGRERLGPGTRGRARGRPALARRVLGGELGSLRVLVMLAVIWAISQLANDRF
jgi:hypothetical protein